MNFQTTKLKRANDLNWELPVDASEVISVSYSDGTLMPISLYSFIPPRLIKLSCPLEPSLFSCINATYITGTRSCGCKSCEQVNDCGCGELKWCGWPACK